MEFQPSAIVTEEDRDLVMRWNSGEATVIKACLHQLICDHAKERPDATAIDAWDGALTFRELDISASRLAQKLVADGTEVEDIVPVCFEKTKWAIVAEIAVLKAGAAFAPLDPKHPARRHAAVLEKASAKIVLGSRKNADLFSDFVGTFLIVDDQLMDQLGDNASELIVDCRPSNIAFVLFTSGSTGEPKGVIQTHESVCTINEAYSKTFRMNKTTRTLQFASYVFDVSTVDIFTTLQAGGCVCVPSESQRMNGILEFMHEKKVNWADLTPSFVTHLELDKVPSLETLILAGEESKQELVARWAEKIHLFNCYGPAECGGCTAHEYVDSKDTAGTIGRRISSAKCWIVHEDDHNILLPIGAVGELLVEGPTLSRGYLKNDVLTTASFVLDPKWATCDRHSLPRRFYKTGDLLRFGKDGIMTFVGRKDNQVKIRGQRVEIGEIEHSLTTLPQVLKCLVVYPRTGPFKTQLVAVIELDSEVSYSPHSELQYLDGSNQNLFSREDAVNSVGEKVPSYMVPNVWLVVNYIPMSASQKRDRRKVTAWLEDMNVTTASRALQYGSDQKQYPIIDPSDIIARRISDIAISLLSRGDGRLYDGLKGRDFPLTTLGVDSLMAVSLMKQVKHDFGVTLPVELITARDSTVATITLAISSAHNPGPCATPSIADRLMNDVHSLLQALAKPNTRRKTVLLTGVTGFVGIQILRQLLTCLEQPDIIVHVRGTDPKECRRRIIQAACDARWWSDHYTDRFELWCGDLGASNLGLTASQWQRLTGNCVSEARIDGIIHCGAAVRWNESYEQLRAANVLSTHCLLGALAQRPDPVHFVFVSGGQALSFANDEEASDRLRTEGASTLTGYGQSKLVSEMLVMKFAQRYNHWVAVIKPSYIIGSKLEGVVNDKDYMWKLTASAVELGAYGNDERNNWLFVSSVDRVAEACVRQIFLTPFVRFTLVKILDGMLVERFWRTVSSVVGIQMQSLTEDDWSKLLVKKIECDGDKHRLWPLLGNVEQLKGGFGSCEVRTDDEGSEATEGVEDAVRSNLAYLTNLGLLRAPSA